jgi:hypothetical protein
MGFELLRKHDPTTSSWFFGPLPEVYLPSVLLSWLTLTFTILWLFPPLRNWFEASVGIGENATQRFQPAWFGLEEWSKAKSKTKIKKREESLALLVLLVILYYIYLSITIAVVAIEKAKHLIISTSYKPVGSIAITITK